jgi:hypothetical protein
MNLNQIKLSGFEWKSIELEIPNTEKEICNLICKGIDNVGIKYNKHLSLSSFLKINCDISMNNYLYYIYFKKKIDKIMIKYNLINIITIDIYNDKILKKKDKIRLDQNAVLDISKNDSIYEYIIIDIIEKMIKYKQKSNEKMKNSKYQSNWQFHFITISKLIQNNVLHINPIIIQFTKKCLDICEPFIDLKSIINNYTYYIEQNSVLNKYNDMELFKHQKDIFTYIKLNNNPKLILYIAPTGTGKTLTPLGLSSYKRVIFVCAARHIGLALATSAISMGKKTAFAYGCSSAEDIRLHYYSVIDYIKHKKSGGIGKVDNSNGSKVEIMICDIKSYLIAMYYMIAFNNVDNIITYWDEPTISMDYKNHDLHNIIKDNWSNNKIPNMILSSATLPKLSDLSETISDFKCKFDNAEIINIESSDCRKSVPILNKSGYVILPHMIATSYTDMKDIMINCNTNKSLIRYFDMDVLSNTLKYIDSSIYTNNTNSLFCQYFESINDITLTNVKTYYIDIMLKLTEKQWDKLDSYTKTHMYNTLNKSKSNTIDDGQYDPIKLTTSHANTLTHGPTIFISNNVMGVANLYIKESKIPSEVINNINEKIIYNNHINDKIYKQQQMIEDAEKVIENQKVSTSGSDKSKNQKDKSLKKNGDSKTDANLLQMQKDLITLQKMIKSSSLNDTFIPNTISHLNKWNPDDNNSNTFTCDIDEEIIIQIMSLKNVDNCLKILLMMGIGVFTNHKNKVYTEIMKQLANNEKLYLIIASSDYIYGTNYQFCHGYISKDLDLSQEKIIQAIGRIGRNSVQKQYTVRFRSDENINKLFKYDNDKPEIINMNILFNTNNIHFDNGEYIYST